MADRQIEFHQWVTDGNPEALISAELLLRLPAAQREGWLDAHPEALDYHTFDVLIGAALAGLDRDPQDTAALTELLVRRVGDVVIPKGAEIAGLMLQVSAWRQRGNALRGLSDYHGAHDAFSRGLALADSDPALAPESAALRRGVALILHYWNRSEEALQWIRADLPLYHRTGDRANVLLSCFYIASIEYEIGHDEAARAMFLDLLRDAEEQGDRAMQARAHLNLGHCNRRLNDREDAAAHFTAALPLLRDFGMTAEVIRIEWGLALLEAVHDPAAALPVLDRFRDEFLATGRLADAAWVSLDAVTILREAEHTVEARRLAAELVDFFASHGMPREAMQALSDLREAALDDGLTAALLEDVTKRLGAALGD